jgi:hypothetical protein
MSYILISHRERSYNDGGGGGGGGGDDDDDDDINNNSVLYYLYAGITATSPVTETAQEQREIHKYKQQTP